MLQSRIRKGLGKKLTAYTIQYMKDDFPNINWMISLIAENNFASIKSITDNGCTRNNGLNIGNLSLKRNA